MRKRILSFALCLALALTLLTVSALAVTEHGAKDSIADGLAIAGLTVNDTFTVGEVTYTYGGDVSATGLTIGTRPDTNTVYKAGSGYALFTPAAGEGESAIPAALTLNNATVEPTSGAALVLGTADIKLVLEDSSSLTGTNSMAMCATAGESTSTVNVTIGGDGSLTLNGVHETYGSFRVGNLTIIGTAAVTSPYGTAEGSVTVENGATLNAVIATVGGKTVYGKVTIAEGVSTSYSGLTFQEGSNIEVNGTLTLTGVTTFDEVKSHLTGTGVVKVGTGGDAPSYINVGDEWVNYGGDVPSTGLDLGGGKAPDVKTGYKAGDGYALFTPAAGEGESATPATLTFTNATISVESYIAVTLPNTPVEVTFNGTNSIGATVSFGDAKAFSAQYTAVTFTLAPGSSTTITATGNTSKVIASISGSITINGSGALILEPVVNDPSPAANGYAISTDGDITIDSGTVYEPRGETTSSTHGTGGIVAYTVTLGKVTIPAGGTLDVHDATILSITENQLVNNGTLVLKTGTTTDQIDALGITGTGVFTINGADYINEDGVWVQDVTNTGLDLTTFPSHETTYKAGSGYARFTPAAGEGDSATPATLTLHNATIEGAVEGTVDGVKCTAGIFAANDLNLVLEGTSTVATNGAASGNSSGILSGGSLTISGGGTLTATGGASDINSSGIYCKDALTIQGSATVSGSVADDTVTGSNRYGIYGGSITITGYAKVIANAGKRFSVQDFSSYNYGIQSVYNLTISGNATVNANGGENTSTAFGIFGHTKTITIEDDANVTATGGTTGRSASYGIYSESADITIQGRAKVTAKGGTTQGGDSYGIDSRRAGITIQGSAKVTAKGGTTQGGDSYGINGVNTEVVSSIVQVTIKDTATVTATASRLPYAPTVDENATLNALIWVGGTAGDSGTPTVYGKVTIAENEERSFSTALVWKDGSSLQNNGLLTLAGDTFDDVKDKITGIGIVRIVTGTEEGSAEPNAWAAYYTDGRTVLHRSDALIFTAIEAGGYWSSDATLAENGYTFTGSAAEGYVLTLGDLVIVSNDVAGSAAIQLPVNGEVEVKLVGDTRVYAAGVAMGFGRESTAYPCTISGSGSLLMVSSGMAALNSAQPLTISGGNIKAMSATNTPGTGYGVDASDLTIKGGTLTARTTVGGGSQAFFTAPKFTGYTPRVTYGDSADSTRTELSPTDTVYTSNKYIKIEKYVSSGGGSAPAPTVEAPATDGGETIVKVAVKPTVSGTTEKAKLPEATITKAVDSAAGAAKTNGTEPVVEINVKPVSENTRKVEVTIPAKSVEKIAESNAALKVTTGVGQVSIPAQTVSAISEKTEGRELTISMEAVKPESLTEGQRAMLGERAGSTMILDLTLTAGGVKISDLGGGVTVTIPVTLAEGQKPENLKVWFIADDGSITPCEGSYDPETKTYRFTTNHLSVYALVEFPFTDVPESAWYYGDAAYAYMNKLFSGTSDTAFEPETAMTRTMLVTVLYRLEGEPMVNQALPPFSDAQDGGWFIDGLNWAYGAKLVDGYDDGSFGVNDPVTREQMATILWRYAQYKGYDVSVGEDTNILSYNDALDVSEYAIPAMQWACGASLIQGDNGNLMPQGGAARSQVAAILHRFCENVK